MEFAGIVAVHGVDGGGVHQRAAVDLPERGGVQLWQEVFERSAYQVFMAGRDHAHVFVCSLKVKHLVDRHHADGIAYAGLDHGQRCHRRTSGRSHQRTQLRHRLLQICFHIDSSLRRSGEG